MKLISYSLRHMLSGMALVAVASVASFAQDLKAKLPVDPEVVTGKLDNGLTYYIRPNHKPEKKVELRLAVKAGSILENDDQRGLAHFMEHMNFNGTKNFQKNELVSYLQSIGVQFGADLNAYTAFDQTVYILPIPLDKPDNLEKGFQIIEDWAHNALLTDKDIDEERGVVLEESRLGKGADDRMLKKYFPKLAEGSLYADRLPIGTDDVIKNSTYDKTRSFYHDWYRPDLQAVIIVGDIDVATAKKMLNKHFAGLKNPANEKVRKYVDIKPRKAPEAMVVTDKEATNSVMILTFPYTKKQESTTMGEYRGDLVKNIAQSIINHRLNDLAQGSNPPFPYAGVGLDGLVHGYEAFQCYALISSNGTEKAINTVTGEIVKARKFGVTASELELGKKEMMSNIERSYNERKTTDSKQYVEEYIRAFLDKEPIPGIANEFSYYKSMLPGITVADVNAVIKQWTSSTNTFTLITAPENSDVKLPGDKELLAMTEKGFKQDIAKTEEKAVATDLMPTKPTPGKVVSQVKEEGFDATTYTLSNGIKVTIRPTTYKSDEILMNGVKKGGSNAYKVADKSNAHFATDLIEAMGIGAFSPTDLEKVLAGKNISVNAAISDISDEIKATSTVKDLESMLQVVHLYITQPRKDEGLFNAYKEKQISMTQFIMSNPQAGFADTVTKVMYDNNPLAKIRIPKKSDYDAINLDRSLEIYKNEIGTADGYHFFLVGNVDPATAVPLIETYLGSLPKSNTTPAISDNGVRPIKGVHNVIVKKGKEKKSLILAMYTGETRYSEDMALKTQALAEVLNIRVIEVLREKMGAIYGGGFNGNLSKEPYERYSIQLALPCGPENVDKLIAAANEEIKNLKEKGPDAKDIDKVKSQWHEKHVTDLKENKYWADKMQGVIFWGKDKDRVLQYDSYIQKLTPADIQATAKLLFDGKNECTFVLNPES